MSQNHNEGAAKQQRQREDVDAACVRNGFGGFRPSEHHEACHAHHTQAARAPSANFHTDKSERGTTG